MGDADRIIRVVLAVLFAGLYFTGIISGTLGLVLMIFSSIFLLTSLVAFCPLYTIIGLKTCPKED